MKKPAEKLMLTGEPAWLKGNRPFFIFTFSIFLVYFPALWYGFSPMDERWVILQHKAVMSDLHQLPGMFFESTLGMYYRPAWTSSFIIDMVLGHGSPAFFHFTNILLHIACTLAAFKFLLQLNITRMAAFLSAMIFAVHPVNLHTVAWIPGRNDSLLCLFTLLSCAWLLSYFNSRKIIFLALHLGAFCLALFTKENAIVLPLVYFFLWYLFRKEKNAAGISWMLSSWIAITLSWFFLRLHFIDYFPAAAKASILLSIGHSLSAFILYLGKTIIPVQQSVMPVLEDTPLVFFALVTLAFCILVIRLGLKNKQLALFGAAWFFIFLAIPVWVGSTNSNGEHYEHRAYTSLVGFFIFISQVKIQLKPVLLRRLVFVLLMLFSIKTVVRAGVYKNEISFLEAATEESPSVAFFHDMLGFKYAERKDFKMALGCFNEAIRLNPHKPEYYNDRGNACYQLRNYRMALEDFNKAMEDGKLLSVKLVNRSMTYFYLGDHADALRDLERADKMGAQNIPGDYIDALYKACQNDTIALWTDKLRTDSTDASAYNQRGIARMRIGLYREALADFDKAIEIRPASDAIRSNRNLAIAAMNQGNPGK